MTPAAFKVKTFLILILLSAWALIAAVHTYNYAVRKKDSLLKNARQLAWREVTVPAQRGRILDRDGKILAHDRLHCDLILERIPASKYRLRKFRELWEKNHPDEKMPDLNMVLYPLIIRADLSPEEMLQYQKKEFRQIPEIRAHAYFVRETDSDSELQKLIGKTARNDRQESVGVSGLEQQHDMTLSGKSGLLIVMLDRYGYWVNDTLKVIRQPKNGDDVRLNESYEKLQAPHEK